MNDEPTAPAFFRPAAPKKEPPSSWDERRDVQEVKTKAKEQLAILKRATDASESAGERRYTLGEALKIVSGLRTEDMARFSLIASALEEMSADGRKRVVDTIARIFR